VRARSETPRTEPRCLAPVDTNMTYFNCDKLGYFAFICPEPRKGNLKEIKGKKSYELEEKNKSGKKEP
jgi:hypothetical protein